MQHNTGEQARTDAATAAVRAVFPPDVAADIEADDAFGALAYRLHQHATATDTEPSAVLDTLDPDDLAFTASADHPAAFLAAKIRNLTSEGR